MRIQIAQAATTLKGPRKLTDEQLREAAALHADGLPITRIAARYQISHVNLRKWLRRYGFHVASNRETAARRRHPCDDDFFECIDTETKAYWAGFITADGCITQNRNSPVLSISVATTDRNHLRALLGHLNTSKPITDFNGQSIVGIYSHKLCADLTLHGIGPQKTSRERIPVMPTALRRHFIRGYFDGDGWWSLGKRAGWEEIGFCGGRTILEQIREWIRLNVLEAGLPKISSVPGMYRLRYTGGRQVRAIARALYRGHTIALQRKREVVDVLLARSRMREVTK